MNLSKRLANLTSSAIREVGKKIAANNQCISFAGGLPSPEFLPVSELKARICFFKINNILKGLKF